MQSTLVVGRKLNQTIHVDGPAEIVVTKLSASRVRLAVKAERAVRVLRGELKAAEGGEKGAGDEHG